MNETGDWKWGKGRVTAWYNEIDAKAAAWLRELIKRGLIADGVVDERDIRDVRPADLHGFTQCHFFAGIGVWSYALRRAGWPDDRPVWTGSCPCQPFSAAGKGDGFDDERHLWPSFYWLIAQCRPAIVFGEQVASKDAEPWIDLVQDDLEALDYALGAVPFPSAGIGAPHIRDRLFWVADASGSRERPGLRDSGALGEWILAPDSGAVRGMVDALGQRRRLGQSGSGHAGNAPLAGETLELGDATRRGQREFRHASLAREGRYLDGSSDASVGLADAGRERGELVGLDLGSAPHGDEGQARERERLWADDRPGRNSIDPGPTNGLWRDADWLYCRDGKWRPVEPGTFPLAHGAPARVGRLRGYGNAINAEAAIAFIEASGLA